MEDVRQWYGTGCDDPVPAESKPSNPKDLIGSDKLPLHLWPGTATALGSLGLLDGMLKYGRTNWREAGVRYSIYLDAALRHLLAAFEGEDADPDSGLPHEAHALACLAIVIDAKAAGQLVDDRQYPGGYRALVESLTPHVKRLKEKHADKSPKHWTIRDAPAATAAAPEFECYGIEKHTHHFCRTRCARAGYCINGPTLR